MKRVQEPWIMMPSSISRFLTFLAVIVLLLLDQAGLSLPSLLLDSLNVLSGMGRLVYLCGLIAPPAVFALLIFLCMVDLFVPVFSVFVKHFCRPFGLGMPAVLLARLKNKRHHHERIRKQLNQHIFL